MATLDQVVKELKRQNNTLESTQTSIQKMLSEDIAARKQYQRDAGRREEDRREARQQRIKSDRPMGFTQGLKQGVAEASGLSMIADWGRAILGGLFGGATVATIGGVIGKMIGRGAIFGGAAALVGKFGEDIFKSLFAELDPKDIILSGDTKAEIAASLSGAMSAGLVGLLLGKKAGIAAFVGSLIGDQLTKLFNLSETERVNLFGTELPVSEANFAGYGAMIAAYFGPGLIGSALSMAFTGKAAPAGATVGRNAKGQFTKLKPSLRKTFMSNFKPRLGWAAVIATAGGLLANYIGDMTGSEELGDVANWTSMGASFGMMFGPQGALIGALVGFTLSAGGLILERLGKMREDNIANINREIDQLQADAKAAEESGDYQAAADKLRQAANERVRLSAITSDAIGAKQGVETAEQRVDLSEFDGMSKGQKLNAATALFQQTMKSQLADSEKIAKVTKALTLYTQLTGETRQAAYDTLSGGLGFGPASGRALQLRDSILSQPVQRPTLSSTLDRKGITPSLQPAGPSGGSGSGATVVVNAPDQSQSSSSSTTVQTENGVSPRDTVHYSLP